MSSVAVPKSFLPQPTNCDQCGSINVAFATNDIIYGVSRGDWPWCYYCMDCKAAVGCHPNTSAPLGRMADKVTRMLRMLAHAEFDRLWKSEDQFMSRTTAYTWLAEQLGIQFEDCHIGQLNINQWKHTIELVKTNYDALKRIYVRRAKRKQAKFFKRVEREQRRGYRS